MSLLLILFVSSVGFYSLYYKLVSIWTLRSQPLTFKGKLIWITGASSGIGEALAIKLSNLGANLILSSRNHDSLLIVKKKCSSGSTINIVPMDLSDPIASKNTVDKYLQSLKDVPINMIIHNAGVSQRSSFTDFCYKNHEYMVNLNYNGPYAITQSLAKYMIKNSPKPQRNGAQIVVISSMAAKLCPGFRSSYCSTKAALSGLFDSIRVELRDKGFKVTQIYPGYIKSYGSKNALTENVGESLGGNDDDMKKSMDLDVFVDRCIKAIYLEQSEVYICLSWTHSLGVIVKGLFPDFFYKKAFQHFKKSMMVSGIAKKVQ